MKNAPKRKGKIGARTKSVIALSILLIFTVLVGIIGLNGMNLDARGLYKLKPWLPTTDVEKWPSAISLGLDLRGGISVEYTATRPEGSEANFNSLLDGTIAIIQQRLTEKGYPESTVTTLGSNGIRVEIPDVSDPAAVLDLIGSPAKLEFLDPDGNVFMEGKDVQKAEAVTDPDTGKPAISFTLTSEGARVFADMTSKSIGKTIAIMLDGVELMAPTVNSTIPSGEGIITGSYTVEQAKDYAIKIQSGALPLLITQDKVDNISPTLGIDALSSSVFAAIVGILLVMLVMAIRYRLAGILADWALCIYIILLFLLLAVVPGVQLTLPGIAGIILGIGMAVDANVVIFERVNEEIRAGRPVKGAVRAGFKNAMSAVFDANMTTIIAALVLLIFGTGSIQGFAVTLLIGIVTSLFTAIVVSRFLLRNMANITGDKPALYTGRKNLVKEEQ